MRNPSIAVTSLCAIAVFIITAIAAPVSAELVGHWALDEPNGTTGAGSIADATGNFDLTPNGATGLGAAGANANTGTSADLGGGSFDAAYNAALNPASFTFSAWVNPDATAGFQAVVTSRDDVGLGASVNGYILYNDSAGNWSYWYGNGGTSTFGWQPLVGSPVAVGAWQHVAISYDADTSTRRLWVDGSVVASDVVSVSPNTVEGFHLGGGGDNGASFRFDGEIDDAAVYNHSLSALQMENVAKYGVASGAGEWVNASLGKEYSYSRLPVFSGGGFYSDEPHVQAINTFDTGDLTDGVFKDSGEPTVPNPSTIVGWGEPIGLDATIIMDLDGIFRVDLIEIGTHTWSAFRNAAPGQVTIEFSMDGIVWNNAEVFVFTGADVPGDGHHDLVADVMNQHASFVRFSFDGSGVASSGLINKWMLDELTVFGVVPTPAALPAGLGMMMLVFGRRRRR